MRISSHKILAFYFCKLETFLMIMERIRRTNRIRVIKMRFGEKGMSAQLGENQLFGVDFHDFIQKEQSSNMVELASEFGLSVKDVRKLKKHLERS